MDKSPMPKQGRGKKMAAVPMKSSAANLAKRAKLAFVMSGVHGAGKSTDSVPGDKRSMGAKLYQIG